MVAQSVGDRAQKQKAPGSSPSVDKPWKVPKHQNMPPPTTKPRGSTTPSPHQHDPKRDRTARNNSCIKLPMPKILVWMYLMASLV